MSHKIFLRKTEELERQKAAPSVQKDPVRVSDEAWIHFLLLKF